MRKPTKAIIAAAGFGTRFLPQTKAMPKEMLPLIDKPIIQYVVEELVEAGIMEAANRGAMEAGGESVGFNIRLPHEQSLNNYTTDSFAFTHFAPRKIVMTLLADAYVCFPGGFGTMDEICEIITLTQTKKMAPVPIVYDELFAVNVL